MLIDKQQKDRTRPLTEDEIEKKKEWFLGLDNEKQQEMISLLRYDDILQFQQQVDFLKTKFNEKIKGETKEEWVKFDGMFSGKSLFQ